MVGEWTPPLPARVTGDIVSLSNGRRGSTLCVHMPNIDRLIRDLYGTDNNRILGVGDGRNAMATWRDVAASLVDQSCVMILGKGAV